MRVPERAPAARHGGVTPPRGLAWVDCLTRLATAGVRPSMAAGAVTTLTYLGIRRDLPQRQGKRRGTKRGKDRSVPSPIKSYVSRWARGWVGLGIDHLPTFSGCHSGGWRTTASVSSQQGSPPIPRVNERNASAHTGEKNPPYYIATGSHGAERSTLTQTYAEYLVPRPLPPRARERGDVPAAGLDGAVREPWCQSARRGRLEAANRLPKVMRGDNQTFNYINVGKMAETIISMHTDYRKTFSIRSPFIELKLASKWQYTRLC